MESYAIFFTQHYIVVTTSFFTIIVYVLLLNFLLKKENNNIKEKIKTTYQNQLRIIGNEIISLLNKNILREIKKENDEKKKERYLLTYREFLYFLYKISEALNSEKYCVAICSVLLQLKSNIIHTLDLSVREDIDLVDNFFKSLDKIYDEKNIFNMINFFDKNYTSSQSEVINLRRECFWKMKRK